MYQSVRKLFASPNFVIANAVIAGVVGLALATVISNPYTKVVPPLLLVGGAVGFLVKNEELYDWNVSLDPRLPLVGYFTVAAAALVLYTLNDFSRVSSVHALIVGMYLLTALLAFSLDSVRARLGVIAFTGVFHRTLIYYASALPMGSDALFHNRAATLIASSGSLAPLVESKYWYAPVYHLLTASGVTALGVPARDAAFLLVTVVGTLVPALVVFQFLRRVWDESTGIVGSFLFIAADRVVFTTVHTTPTTLGVVLFSLLLLYAERYLEGDYLISLALFAAFVLGLIFTHQLSMFAAFIGITVYLVGNMLWEGSADRNSVQLASILLGAFLFQSLITKYGGPSSDTGSFLLVAGAGIIRGITSGSGRATAELPASAEFAVSGSDALSTSQTIGVGLLLALGVVGTVYWMSRRDNPVNRIALGFTFIAITVSLFIFIGPLFGINAFIPGRWFSFLYVVLAILAAPGVLAILSAGTGGRRHWPVAVLLLLVVFAPFTAFMLGNAYGAPDQPVIEDAPGAMRLSSTPEEASMYQHVDQHGEDTRVLMDFVAWQLVTRHYNHPATIYATDYGEKGTSFSGDMVIGYRSYAETSHASYYVRYQDNDYRVVGSMPEQEYHDSVVYSNGPDELVWREEAE
jgi:hypothetical protein